MELSMQQTQKQTLLMNMQMEQSLRILQMAAGELDEYILAEAEINPVIDLEYRPVYTPYTPKEGADIWQNSPVLTYSLHDELKEQLMELNIPPKQAALCTYLIESLDDNGYLDEDVEDFLSEQGVSHALFATAYETLTGLSPKGVGARNLAECLLLQLSPQEQAAFSPIILRHLEELATGAYGKIAAAEGLSLLLVKACAKKLQTLSPKPGSIIGTASVVSYVIPDLQILQEESGFSAELTNSTSWRMQVNTNYANQLGSALDSETVSYIRKKTLQAQQIIHAVRKREDTLLAVGNAIVALQHDFFQYGPMGLLPQNLSHVADLLEVHPSTISRAVKNKYLECTHGTFPLKYFFASVVDNYSSRQVLEAITSLIKKEREPLSDSQITGLLYQRGMKVARRTTAKYREMLGYPPANIRKLHQK